MFPEARYFSADVVHGLGDNLIHSFVYRYAYQGNGVYDFTPIYKNLADDIDAANLAYINQETVLGGSIQFDFVLNGEERSIENVHFEPNVIHYEVGSNGTINSRTNFEVIPLKDFTPEHEQRHALNGYQGNIVTKDYFTGMVEDVISEEFR